MKVLLIIAAIIFCAAVAFGVNALIAWGAQWVLAAFDVHVGFWVCFVAVLVLSMVFGGATRGSKS